MRRRPGRAFLLNHVISELLPDRGGYRYANADPVTGQAAWYDLRIRIEKAAPAEVRRDRARLRADGETAKASSPDAVDPARRRQGPGSTPMTSLPTPQERTGKKLGLVIDLDICVGCQACAVSCKEWNTGGYSAPLTDQKPYGDEPIGVWLNRIHSYEAGPETEGPRWSTSRAPVCIARSRPASPSARPAPPTSAPKTASSWSIRKPASAASSARGPVPMARANMTTTMAS